MVAGGVKMPFEAELLVMIAEHDRMTRALYEHRFAGRVRTMANALRGRGAVTTDVLFKYAYGEVDSTNDVFQVGFGLERLARQVLEQQKHHKTKQDQK